MNLKVRRGIPCALFPDSANSGAPQPTPPGSRVKGSDFGSGIPSPQRLAQGRWKITELPLSQFSRAS